jgi:hypothetical protein
VVVAERARELGVHRAAPVEVRAHGGYDAGPAQQRGHELEPFDLVVAGGEELFELVDHEHSALQ